MSNKIVFHNTLTNLCRDVHEHEVKRTKTRAVNTKYSFKFSDCVASNIITWELRGRIFTNTIL